MKQSVWVVVLSLDSKRILVAKRSDKVRNSGKWNFLGGRVNDKETTVKAAARELQEEVGIKVNPYSLFLFKTLNTEKSTIFGYIALTKTESRVKLNKESTKYKYVSMDDLRKLNLHLPTKLLIKGNFDKVIKSFVRNYSEKSNYRQVTSSLLDVTYEELSANGLVTISMYIKGEKVGKIAFIPHSKKLCNLHVDKEHRGKGYSKLLLAHLINKYNPKKLIDCFKTNCKL